MTGGTSSGNDPMQLMRDAYAQGIERWSKAMEEIVGSEDFASASGQLLALYAQQQQSIRAASRVAAESIQMPTTEDLAEVAQLVINVERKVDEIADHHSDTAVRLAGMEAQLAHIADDAVPARLDAIEAKLAELVQAAAADRDLSDRLARIEEALAEVARRPSGPSVGPVEETPTPAPAASRPAARKPAAKKPAAKKPAAGGSTAADSTPARRRTPPAGD